MGGLPKSSIRVPHPRPRTPESEDSLAWYNAVSRLERPNAVRLLAALQERLSREERAANKAEAKLQRGPLTRSLVLSSPALEEAKTLSAARCYGVHEEDAAGTRPKVP